MKSSNLNRAALASAFIAAACLPTAAGAVEINDVFGFTGTVTDIGVQRGVGQVGGIEYRIKGKFEYAGLFDLSKSTLIFHNLFDEYLPDGNGEMVLNTDNADLVCPDDPPRPGSCVPQLEPLVASPSSKRDEGKYATPTRFRPQIQVQIERTGDEFEFAVRLDRGTSPQVTPPELAAKLQPGQGQYPKLCALDPMSKKTRPLTEIRHRFTIANGIDEPIVVDFVKDWECDPPGRYHLRSR